MLIFSQYWPPRRNTLLKQKLIQTLLLDKDGVLSKDEFLSFLRGLFVADIPSTEPLFLAYNEAVAKAPDEPMDEAGFDMKSSNLGDVIGVIDADGDGDVDFDEFLTGWECDR